jgi:hypothetical protein
MTHLWSVQAVLGHSHGREGDIAILQMQACAVVKPRSIRGQVWWRNSDHLYQGGALHLRNSTPTSSCHCVSVIPAKGYLKKEILEQAGDALQLGRLWSPSKATQLRPAHRLIFKTWLQPCSAATPMIQIPEETEIFSISKNCHASP